MKIDLKIGGETIPLYFGMVAFEEMQKLVSSYMGTNKYSVDVAWAGYINQCALDSVPASMQYADLMSKLEDYFFEENVECNINEVLDVFQQSKAGSKLYETVDKALDIVEDVKKKMETAAKKLATKRSKK